MVLEGGAEMLDKTMLVQDFTADEMEAYSVTTQDEPVAEVSAAAAEVVEGLAVVKTELLEVEVALVEVARVVFATVDWALEVTTAEDVETLLKAAAALLEEALPLQLRTALLLLMMLEDCGRLCQHLMASSPA